MNARSADSGSPTSELATSESAAAESPVKPDPAIRDGLAQVIMREYSTRALTRQNARIDELRAMSAAMDLKLSELEDSAAEQGRPGLSGTHSRQMIGQSQEKIRRTCSSAERSVKRIERSRALIARGLAAPRPGWRSA
jgi:hypothetical protein